MLSAGSSMRSAHSLWHRTSARSLEQVAPLLPRRRGSQYLYAFLLLVAECIDMHRNETIPA